MTEAEASTTIIEGLFGPESLPVKLRMGNGLDREMLGRVKAAIVFLTEQWKGRSDVPKRVAAAFIDIDNSMRGGGDRYSEEEQQAIEVASIQLVDLAHELFAEAES